MSHKDLIEAFIKDMKSGNLNQKHSRKSKELQTCILESEICDYQKLKSSFIDILKSDTYKCYCSVIILAEGNVHMQNILCELLNQIISSVINIFKKSSSHYNENTFNLTAKALYSLLQYIYPKCEVTEELKHNLKELMFEVEELILHVEINPEVSLIFASSFILLISICTSDPACYFYKLTTKAFERKNFDNDHMVLSSAYYLERKINSTAENNDFNIVPNFNCNLILIHGVLNVQPEWLFNRMLIDDSSTFVNDNSSLLIHLWKFVKIHASYSTCSYQGIQVLQKWIKKVCEFVKEFEKSLEQDSWNVSGKTIDTEHDLKTLKSDLSFTNCRFCTNVSTIKILCIEHGNVVKVLKANLENRIKGVFSLILDSLKEILYLHDYFQSGHLEFSVRKFMESVLKCHHHTRGSFLFIQLTVEVLGPQRVLKDYPTITTTMGFALKTNQFATLATNIYRNVIQKITLDDWVEYFRPIHEMILQTSDVEFWSNYKNLWLPITIYHHPKLVSLLLKVSENSTWEFESKITILRMFRSYNDVNMFEAINCNDFDILEYLTYVEEQAGDNDNEDIDFENYMPSKLFYLKCLLHGELTVRSEFFSMLCSTKKSLIPLSHFEVILLKLFFSQNMNIDSQSFRQSLLKSFSNLIIRVRDCCTHEIKKYKNNFSESVVKIVLQSDMKHTIDFLVWIILHLNENLKFLGNYSRLSTTLNLYWILLETFYGNCKLNKDCGNSKYKSVGNFLNMATRTNEDVILPSFTCRTTFNSLLFCSVNEMDDIRLSSSRILILLYQQKSLYDIGSSNCKKDVQEYEKLFYLWFDLAIKLIDSPKASDMEGGADLMNILLEIRPEKVFYVPKSLKFEQDDAVDSQRYHEQIINDLLLKIEKQFAIAQQNILYSSYKQPIAGSIIALTHCLVDCCRVKADLSSSFVFRTISILESLYSRLVVFALDSLAESSGGKKGAPSFEEMGRSIDSLIARHGHGSVQCNDDDLSLESVCVETVISELDKQDHSSLHQFVLSFLWHIMKTCCWSAAKLIQQYSAEITDEHFKSFFINTVITVLLRTRHKGAMESAQEALGVMTQCAFIKPNSLRGDEQRIKIVEDQLYDILNKLESTVHEHRISTTRRSAGYAMLFTSVCSNIQGRHSIIREIIIEKLLKIATVKVERVQDFDESSDLPSTLSLHILHSLVQCSKLNSFFETRLSIVAIVCLQCFSSKIWSIRNAALQLFGAIVPKILGQKKVKEDSSVFNSITAGEFCSKNTSLICYILKILSICCESSQKTLKGNYSEREAEFTFSYLGHKCHILNNSEKCSVLSTFINLDVDETSIQKNTSSFLVPLLGLLARLNPGNEIQQNEQIKCYLYYVVKYTLTLLGNRVFAIRKLAATSLVGILDSKNKQEMIHTIINKTEYQVVNNLLHGFLLFFETIIKNDSNFLTENDSIKTELLSWLKNILKNTHCLINSSLIIYLLTCLESDSPDYQIMVNIPEGGVQPGSSVLKRNLSKLRLKSKQSSLYDSLISKDQDIWEEAYLMTNELLTASFEKTEISQLQSKLFSYIESQTKFFDNSNFIRFVHIMELLSNIFEYESSKLKLNETNIQLFQKTFEMKSNIRLCSSVIFSYFVKNLNISLLSSETKPSVIDLLFNWAEIVLHLSTPKMNEDCRLCASRCLRIALDHLFNRPFVSQILFPLLKAGFNLLQDEDQVIRSKSSFIISLNVFNHLSSISSSIILRLLCHKITQYSMESISFLDLIWNLGVEQYFENDISSTIYLFESNTDNAYLEPHLVLEIFNSQFESKKYLKYNIRTDDKFPDYVHLFVNDKEMFLKEMLSNLVKNCKPSNIDKVINYELLMKLFIIELAAEFLKNLVKLFDLNYDIKCFKNFKMTISKSLFPGFHSLNIK